MVIILMLKTIKRKFMWHPRKIGDNWYWLKHFYQVLIYEIVNIGGQFISRKKAYNCMTEKEAEVIEY